MYTLFLQSMFAFEKKKSLPKIKQKMELDSFSTQVNQQS